MSVAQTRINSFIDRYSKKKVALVHEFLVQYGGAERVLEAIMELFPNAPIYTLVYDRNRFGRSVRHKKIIASFFQRLPFGVAQYKKYLPLMPKAIESFDFRGYDLVISDSSSFAKGAITHLPTQHISYIHTPTRFIWLETEYYVRTTGVAKILQSWVIKLLHRMKSWDYQAAQRPQVMIANSKNVQKRIKKIYHRSSSVIHPFVNAENFSPTTNGKNYYLMGGRLVQYKRYDIVIEAFQHLNRPLKIFGAGQDRSILEKLAKHQPNITFTGRLNDQELKTAYSQARAYLYPGEEDFGIQPLEAMASGIPVIAYGKGGVLETVVEGITGHFFSKQTPEAVIEAIRQTESMKFDRQTIRAHALKFSKEQFMIQLSQTVDSVFSKHQKP